MGSLVEKAVDTASASGKGRQKERKGEKREIESSVSLPCKRTAGERDEEKEVEFRSLKNLMPHGR